MSTTLFCLASIMGGLSVLFGAFGAHYLKNILSVDTLQIFETGVKYQIYHTFALFVASWANLQWPSSGFSLVYWIFLLGTCIFSGSIYLLALTDNRSWGIGTPIGGILLLMGWTLLTIRFWNI